MDIVLLHGWMHSKNDFNKLATQLKALQKIKHTIAIDLPGFGVEPLVSEEWGIPEYSDWVIKVITKRKLKNVILVGHSFGGRIAAFIASQNPSWLHAVILSGTPALYRPTALIKAKKFVAHMVKPFLVPKNTLFHSDDYKAAQNTELQSILKNVIPFDQTTTLPHIKVPVLLVWGEFDASVSLEIANEMKSLIPHSTLRIISKGEHNAFITEPYIFFGYVKKFIETL